MKRPIPLRCMWTGNSLVPDKRTLAHCIKEFGDGEIVTLERNEERSEASHRHTFAWLHQAYLNLPEHLARKHPSEEALRKWALIETGYCHEDISVWDSAKDAMTAGLMMRKLDTYCVVVVSGRTVRRYTAMSQSVRSMGKKTFQESKTAIMDLISSLIGVSPEELRKAS